jgi:predicted dinucleotide-binding enzyme
MTIPEAISKADVVILAIYFDAIKEVLVTYRSDVVGNIIVDPSNPLSPGRQGRLQEDDSGRPILGPTHYRT